MLQSSSLEAPVDINHAQQSAPSPPSPGQHEAGRRFGVRAGLYQAVTQGVGEQYLSAFALLFQATPLHLSILSAMPQVLGTWAQLVSVKVSHWFSDRKSQIFWSMMGQALSWIPILVLPFLWPQAGPWLVMAGVGVYFACTHFGAPAWNSLITNLLEDNERGMYFARRARVIALASFVALCLGGALLSLSEQFDHIGIGFAVLFLVAGLCRGLSALTLSRVTDFPQCQWENNPTGFRAFLRAGTSPSFRRFLLFSGLMHGAVLISAPFFVLYMLQDLHWPYWKYGTWLAVSIIGQFVTLTAWGQFGDRFGNKALLTITGYLLPVLPMLYLLSTAWPFLVVVNFFGGVVWAGLSLGLQNYLFDSVEPADRPKGVAVASLVNAFGWAAGTLAGSWLIAAVPDRLQLGGLSLHPISNLPLIFFLSGILRLMIAGVLLRTLDEPRHVEHRPQYALWCELPLLKPLLTLALRREMHTPR